MRSPVNNKIRVVTLTRAMLDLEGSPWAIVGERDGSASLKLDFPHLMRLAVMGGTRVEVLRAIGAAIRDLVPEAADLLEGYAGYGEGLAGHAGQCPYTVYGGPGIETMSGSPDLVFNDARFHKVARCINSDRHEGDHLLRWERSFGWPPRPPEAPSRIALEEDPDNPNPKLRTR